MNIPAAETRNHFEQTLDWLKSWACSRLFGLGSRVPWDRQWLIESLSDSTIYMAYYTVAHLIQGRPRHGTGARRDGVELSSCDGRFLAEPCAVGGTLDGHSPNAAGIKAEQMTDAVWDYVLGGAPLPDDQLPAGVSRVSLDKMKREFDYWCVSQRDCGR